jgi:hypothetical protein
MALVGMLACAGYDGSKVTMEDTPFVFCIVL